VVAAVIVSLGRWAQPWLKRGIRLLLAIPLALALSGCLDYRLELNFRHAQSSQLVQQLHLDRRYAALNRSTTAQEFTSLAKQTRQAGGRVQYQDTEAIRVSLPFGNGRDLATKLAQLLAPLRTQAELPPLNAEVTLQQQNFLLAVRDRLTLRADLRGLGIQDKAGQALLTPGRLLNLTVHLSTPWGFEQVAGAAEVEGDRLTWTLQPGLMNELAVVFWLPSPLGWGALLIGLLVAGGALIRSRQRKPEVAE
jgi:hypothetical protein